MQPAKYPFSKDYDALYKHMMAGGEALGFVDEEFIDHNAITFQTVVERSPFSMQEQNGSVRVLMRGMISFWTERDVFVRECKILNLEWIDPSKINPCEHGCVLQIRPFQGIK
jgi:hypothetical protein